MYEEEIQFGKVLLKQIV